MQTRLFHLHALSALHVGVGQAIGVVDLPIMRARASHLPIVPGSAIKGVLRDEFDGHEQQKMLFGPAEIKDSAHAGAIAFGDAHLLALPVRALAGVCAFVTCPFVLHQYRRDWQRSAATPLPDIPPVSGGTCRVTQQCVNRVGGNRVVLEDLDIAAQEGADDWARCIAEQIYPNDADWQARFGERFIILSDDVFAFLCDTATEVRARIRIDDERGTVARGALWYEENLPAESLLWGLVAFGPARDGSGRSADEVARLFGERLRQPLLQIGGKATVGRGLVRFVI